MLKTRKNQDSGTNTNTKARKGNLKVYLILIVCGFWSLASSAQCAMCRAVLETEDGGQKAEAVNDGIVYLMVFPYLLVGILAFFIYRLRKKSKNNESVS